jgi:hypothetical protein
MQEEADFRKRVDEFRLEMESEQNPERILEIKRHTDELIIELSQCARRFFEAKELNGKGVLPFVVADRAFSFMGNIVTKEWLTEAVYAKLFARVDRARKHLASID